MYTRKFPEKANELIQYNYIIHSASQSYVWENVYAYDKEFRRHIECHPTRNWGVILQQTWTMLIKGRILVHGNGKGSFHGNDRSMGNGNTAGPRKKICFGFNQGKCTYSSRCKFEHRCGLCGKFGHGAFNCQKALNTAAAQQQQNRETVTRGDHPAPSFSTMEKIGK